MSFVDAMAAYFRDEKLEALFSILPIGLFLVAPTTTPVEHLGVFGYNDNISSIRRIR